MSEQIVTAARALLEKSNDFVGHYDGYHCACGRCQFDAEVHDLVRGLLAEVKRLLGEITEARAACPAVRMDKFSGAPLLALVNEEVSQLFRMQSRAEHAEAEVDRLRNGGSMASAPRKDARYVQADHPTEAATLRNVASELRVAAALTAQGETGPAPVDEQCSDCGWDGGLRRYCARHNPCFPVDAQRRARNEPRTNR